MSDPKSRVRKGFATGSMAWKLGLAKTPPIPWKINEPRRTGSDA